MKQFIFILLFIKVFTAFGQNVYYVQDPWYNENASDLNLGTDINYPLATLQRAFNVVDAGDTVYMRDGIWYPTSRMFHDATKGGGDNNGTYDNHIVIMNYPGETPVLDFKNLISSTGNSTGLGFQESTYIDVFGITVRNVRQLSINQYIVGIGGDNIGVMRFERMVSHNHGGYGYQFNGYDTLYMINCDAFLCMDTLATDPGDKADGFGGGSGGTKADTFKVAYYEGCRAWLCSDDGFDFGTSKQVYVDYCWSFNNGHLEFGGGSGFKFNLSSLKDPSKRTIQNSIAALMYNQYASATAGFIDVNLYDPEIGPVYTLYNNISYKNDIGFADGAGDYTYGEGFGSTKVKNNLSFASRLNNPAIGRFEAIFAANNFHYPYYADQSNNTWIQKGPENDAHTVPNPNFTVTADDFTLVLDSANIIGQLSAARNDDGSLPHIDFFKLRPESDLVDAGIDVGQAFNGSAPDIGPFECNIVAVSGNKYPFVKIVTPKLSNTILDLNENIIEVDARDLDGSIKRVEVFYNDTDTVAIKTSPPWIFHWDNVLPGNYSIRAVAFDNQDARTTSERIDNITVLPENKNNFSGENLLFPNPNNGHFTFTLAEPLETVGKLTILTLNGKILYEGTMNNTEYLKVFNLSTISDGCYVLCLTERDNFYWKKFVKF